jgi:hypothetical protein
MSPAWRLAKRSNPNVAANNARVNAAKKNVSDGENEVVVRFRPLNDIVNPNE